MKELFYRYFLGMFCEHRNGTAAQMSIGRVLLAIASCAALYVWVHQGKEVPAGLQTFLLSIAAYVLGSKINGTIRSFSNRTTTVSMGNKLEVPSDPQ